jgi:hypothetical protein
VASPGSLATSPGARRLVPAYAISGGRTRSAGQDLPLDALVSTTAAGVREVVELRFEQRDVVLLCRRPQAVIEVAARLRLPLGVARVVVSDLVASGHLAAHLPDFTPPAPELLERLLTGLRSL